MGRAVLTDADENVFAYYSDIRKSGWGNPPAIAAADQVWHFVEFGTEAFVSRRAYGNKRIYISLECGCAWEREYGLQIVFRDGNSINKVGPFDGHLSNADSFDDPSLVSTIYAG